MEERTNRKRIKVASRCPGPAVSRFSRLKRFRDNSAKGKQLLPFLPEPKQEEFRISCFLSPRGCTELAELRLYVSSKDVAVS